MATYDVTFKQKTGYQRCSSPAAEFVRHVKDGGVSHGWSGTGVGHVYPVVVFWHWASVMTPADLML